MGRVRATGQGPLRRALQEGDEYEALIALEVQGWVEVRMGSGVYVLDRSHRAARAGAHGSRWGPLELIRARRVVEGEIAALAARPASAATSSR